MQVSNLGLYQKSISDEFKIYQNRVRNIIGAAHWGEEGRYKEIILMNILRRFLPKHISIGTGFIMKSQDVITKQIDIIIYDNRFPLIFSEGDFIISHEKNVLGIVEVKTRITVDKIDEVIDKATENGRLIGKDIFNGVFSYENSLALGNPNLKSRERLENALKRSNGHVNHISFGENFFVKFWENGDPDTENMMDFYSIYRIKNFSFPYFISNLIEKVCKKSLMPSQNNSFIDMEDFSRFLYTIEGGKENYRVFNVEL